MWIRTGTLGTCALVCLAVSVLGAACSSNGAGTKPPPDDAAADAAPSGRSCQDIRACIATGCGDGEQACIQRCVDMGTADAKTAFQRLAACTSAQCSSMTAQCTCEQQCYAEGKCLDATDACVAAPTDVVCDTFCH